MLGTNYIGLYRRNQNICLEGIIIIQWSRTKGWLLDGERAGDHTRPSSRDNINLLYVPPPAIHPSLSHNHNKAFYQFWYFILELKKSVSKCVLNKRKEFEARCKTKPKLGIFCIDIQFRFSSAELDIHLTNFWDNRVKFSNLQM